jgi:hypothetical protein
MDRSSAPVVQSVSDISSSLTPRTAEMSADIYGLIVREIPQLRGDKRVLTLLEASVGENVATLLHVIQHGIDLENVHTPAAAEEYARRLAQRGIPASALLRAYRIGSARFQDWCLEELGRSTDNVAIVSAAALRIADMTSAYIDKVSEEVLSAYEAGKEGWLRNRSVARAARVQALLRGERVDVDSSEAILGYRLRQYHVGVVCWSRRPRRWHVRRALRAGRPSCRKTKLAPGPGCRSVPRMPSPPRLSACGRSEKDQGSGSLSVCPVPASPASAAPSELSLSVHTGHHPHAPPVRQARRPPPPPGRRARPRPRPARTHPPGFLRHTAWPEITRNMRCPPTRLGTRLGTVSAGGLNALPVPRPRAVERDAAGRVS